MTIQVRLFAAAKDAAGTDTLALDLPDGATIGDLRRRMAEDFPPIADLLGRVMFAIDTEYAGDAQEKEDQLAGLLRDGSLTATELLSSYCRTLYARLGSYEQVARHIELDRRTVKKYIERGAD